MKLEIHHMYNSISDEKVYEAIYLDDLLLVDWTTNGTVEINENHPAVREAVHINRFTHFEIE